MLADSVAGVAPATIVTAELDPLRDEAEAYGRRLVEAGVTTTMRRCAGMVHGFVGLDGLDASEAVLDDLAATVRNLGDASSRQAAAARTAGSSGSPVRHRRNRRARAGVKSGAWGDA